MMKRNGEEASSKDRQSGWSLGSQLLLSVNGVLLVLALIFLTYDYHRDLRSRVEEKRIALHEEAKTKMPAILRMEKLGRSHVQQYIDAVWRDS